jgi:hypothetical protein
MLISGMALRKLVTRLSCVRIYVVSLSLIHVMAAYFMEQSQFYKATVAQIVQKLVTVYGTRRSTAASTKTRP